MARVAEGAAAGAKALARRVLAAPPAYPLLRARALRGGAAALLCYHTLGADDDEAVAWTVLRAADFRAHLDAIRADWDIVPLEAALAAPTRGGRPRAVLTFDDGEAGLRRHLLPIVEEERVPVTIYVATGQIETGRPYWFDRVMNALRAEGAFEIDLSSLRLGTRRFGAARGAARWPALSDLLEALKRGPPAALEAAADAVEAAAPPARGAGALAPLTRAELGELARHPLVTIGAHSHGHELLDRVPEAEARASVARSRALLENWTSQPVRHFAYPNGNHDAAVRRLVGAAGFATAAALGQRLLRPGADPFALPRLAIGRWDDAARLRLRLVEI